MRTFVVSNGLQAVDGMPFLLYVRANNEQAACDVARSIWDALGKRFDWGTQFTENITAFLAEQS